MRVSLWHSAISLVSGNTCITLHFFIELRLLTWHNPEITQWSPGPFPHKTVCMGLDVMQSYPILGLISCAGVTGRWGLLSHARSAEALQRHLLFVQLSFVQLAVFRSKIVNVMCCRCTNVCMHEHVQKRWRYRKYYYVANKFFWLLSQH